MVDLKTQYLRIREEIDREVIEVIASAKYINGPKVREFQKALEAYLDVNHVIPCANGTDALQIALMALDLHGGDEVIVPSFTYVATAEVIALLGLKPIMTDVDPDTFNITSEIIEKAITPKTKAIVPVHLFGQCADMESIMMVAKNYGLPVIEDTAQALSADYFFYNGKAKKAGTIGTIGCTSFFPSKNLGCYGDGGAMITNDDELATKLRLISNHGQSKKYFHSVIGVNSRLDAIQAAVLKVKLRYLDEYSQARQRIAAFYDEAFQNLDGLKIPVRQPKSTHIFHQYTLLVKNGRRNELKAYLAERGIPSNIYYPLPLYKQEAFKKYFSGNELPFSERLCQSVLSLPIHTEMSKETLEYIVEGVITFFSNSKPQVLFTN